MLSSNGNEMTGSREGVRAETHEVKGPQESVHDAMRASWLHRV